jgi:hypothetical protein
MFQSWGRGGSKFYAESDGRGGIVKAFHPHSVVIRQFVIPALRCTPIPFRGTIVEFEAGEDHNFGTRRT